MQHQRSLGREVATALLLVLALVIGACGGSTDSTGDETTASTTAVTTAATTAASTTVATTTTTGAATTEATTSTQAEGPRSIEVVGLDEAFSENEITVSAGETVTIIFNNKDTSGEPHNFRLIGPSSSWSTEVADAPDIQEITFSINEPGDYMFLCEIHPQTMTGTLVVTP